MKIAKWHFTQVAILVACGFLVTSLRAEPAKSSVYLADIEPEVNQAIEHRELPGAVVLILHKQEPIYHKAFGSRSLEPTKDPMTPDTIFDLASLTKPVATATSIFLLHEQGKLKLEDPVAKYWPAFGQNGKDKITLEQCLLHISGLTNDNSVADYDDGKAKALKLIAALKLENDPGAKFRYSDVGFIVLGEIVERVSGQPLDMFAQENIFRPLGMKDTGFWKIDEKIPPALMPRFAPTTKVGDLWLTGQVHDPRARRLGSVAGHAGLFSTAGDLAIFCRMILNGGEHAGQRILQKESVQKMTEPCPVPGGLRARGWDMDTSYSKNRGDFFPKGKSFGHTGFTGTSLWLDPATQTAVIFLSNRVHPNEKGNVTKLRATLSSLAAQAVGYGPVSIPPEPIATRPGIDVLVREDFARLNGRNIGLVTNHTGRDRQGRSTIDLLHQAPGVRLVALFSPEHGIRGAVDARVADAKDEKTGLPIYSLYGQRLKPTAETLQGIDTLVYDIQDAGCRFYTYLSTLGNVMEAAAEHKLKLYVLDRPNPIGGLVVAGPLLDPGRESFTAWHRLPIRHGMTVGESALLFNAERKMNVDLEVVKMEGWKRGYLYDRTGLEWINPSPNLRSLTAALLYPGIGLLETTNLSVGRGTERPFEWIGAPWLDAQKLIRSLSQHSAPGVRFVPVTLTPASSIYAGQPCHGVQIFVDDWSKLDSIRLGLTLALVLSREQSAWQVDKFDRLLAHKQTLESVRAGKALDEITAPWSAELGRFLEVRKKYLLYNE